MGHKGSFCYVAIKIQQLSSRCRVHSTWNHELESRKDENPLEILVNDDGKPIEKVI